MKIYDIEHDGLTGKAVHIPSRQEVFVPRERGARMGKIIEWIISRGGQIARFDQYRIELDGVSRIAKQDDYIISWDDGNFRVTSRVFPTGVSQAKVM